MVEADVDVDAAAELVAPQMEEAMHAVQEEFDLALEEPEAMAFGFGDFEAAYIDCDEFAGVGPVFNVDEAESLVPDDYTLVEPFPGARLLVAQAGDCADIEVNGWSWGPGKFAQIGLAVIPPGDPGSGDFYQLGYATTNPLLALRLWLLGVNARWSPFMTYDITDDQLTVIMPHPSAFAFRLDGAITLPDPDGTPNPTTVFNYYAQGFPFFGNVLQSNVVEGIIFGEGDDVMLTPLGASTSALTFGEELDFPFFSAPEIFDRADVIVTTNEF